MCSSIQPVSVSSTWIDSRQRPGARPGRLGLLPERAPVVDAAQGAQLCLRDALGQVDEVDEHVRARSS
jgi:hypothetical protein